MLTGKSSLELQAIAAHGGSLELDASKYSSLELQAIAGKLQSGAYLKLLNSSGKNTLELQAIAGKKPGQVIFA